MDTFISIMVYSVFVMIAVGAAAGALSLAAHAIVENTLEEEVEH